MGKVVSADLQGALIQTSYVTRVVNAYPLHDSDIEALSLFNSLSLLFFNCCSFLLALAFGIWTNAAFVETPTPAGQILSSVASPILVGFAIVFLAAGLWAHSKRTKVWSAIKETKV